MLGRLDGVGSALWVRAGRDAVLAVRRSDVLLLVPAGSLVRGGAILSAADFEDVEATEPGRDGFRVSSSVDRGRDEVPVVLDGFRPCARGLSERMLSFVGAPLRNDCDRKTPKLELLLLSIPPVNRACAAALASSFPSELPASAESSSANCALKAARLCMSPPFNVIGRVSFVLETGESAPRCAAATIVPLGSSRLRRFDPSFFGG